MFYSLYKYLVERIRGDKPPKRCAHVFVDGFGGMGDAVTCVKCGLSRYPEALSLYSRTRPVLVNDGTYGDKGGGEYPYVVKFDKTITFQTDWDTWTH